MSVKLIWERKMLYLPYGSDEKKIKIGQATNDTSVSHFNRSYTALDFSLSKGDDIFAMADGVVVAIYNDATDFTKNKTVYDDLSPRPGAENSLGDSLYGNFVTVKHQVEVDGEIIEFYATYSHLSQDSMGALQVDDPVTGGETFLGEVGYTGAIIGDHMHLQISTESYNPKGNVSPEKYSYALGTNTAENNDLMSKLTFYTADGESVSWGDIEKRDSLESTVDVDKKAEKIANDFDGFEDPTLPGWDTRGEVTSEASFDVFQPGGSSPAQPTEGNRMAVVTSLSNVALEDLEVFAGLDVGTLEGTTGSAMTKFIDLKGKQDSFEFDFYFDSGDYTPYNDAAYLVVDGEAFLLSNVEEVGDYGDGGWQTFGFGGLDKGEHQVSFITVDLLDEILESALYIDNFQIA
jgi:hypothetical protein